MLHFAHIIPSGLFHAEKRAYTEDDATDAQPREPATRSARAAERGGQARVRGRLRRAAAGCKRATRDRPQAAEGAQRARQTASRERTGRSERAAGRGEPRANEPQAAVAGRQEEGIAPASRPPSQVGSSALEMFHVKHFMIEKII